MQQIDYMALKVHFIDSDWKLRRKMLNFCQVPDDNEDTVGEIIESCLVDLKFSTSDRIMDHGSLEVVKDFWAFERLEEDDEDYATYFLEGWITVLDPRFKLDYVSFCFSEIYDDSTVEEMVKRVKELLFRLYEVYSASDSTPGCPEASNDDDQCHDEWINKFLEFKEKKGLRPRNVDKYLLDPCEDPANDKFDMLHWWKVHSTRYRILSGLARDVFAIPLPTMASSESAFSTGTGGRALNKHWSSYTPKFAQALMCSQDWLRTLPSSPVLVDDDETLIRDTQFYEEIESEFFGPPPRR
ncbi:hypothetical protein D8674_009192 [Pyrus ussuriensis x Pyrus communis]|uniref:Zinc finger BED domain-containing protein RICESLEEPER 2-like n=1 Tax=Pyrus ussuriensis x Pyrus communis TaxID=2448454 RepID=A0A5N5HXW6_9ROSA|nr:hypothetical protein D8674_009192 [Pyrus ussuriensis x Pyrus communis]